MSDVASNALPRTAISQRDDTATENFRVAVFTREQVASCRHWAYAFANERKDHRYYELVEDTILPEFDYRYFVIQDESGEVRAVQPFFLLDQDMLAGTNGWIKAAASFVRRLFPRFMLMRTLMVGCAAGEGHLDSGSDLPLHLQAQILAAEIATHARELRARLIVLKEFPAAERAALECFLNHGYTRVPSLPMTKVSIKHASFDEYMSKTLSRRTRTELRRKFKSTEKVSVDMTVVRDITSIIDDVYPLYINVYERAALRFEKLTKDYFCKIGQEMPDKVRFFVWRSDDRIIAFGMCMVDRDEFCTEYLGLDYEVAFDLNMYYIAVRDVMTWAIGNGYTCFRSTGLNYEPKYRLRYLLDPLDLYVKHTSPVFNFLLKYILPLVEPTRYDRHLKRFANYKELWPPKPSANSGSAPIPSGQRRRSSPP